MKKLLTHPLFLFGLSIRILALIWIQPKASLDWYAPFLELSTAQFSLDPWNTYLSQGGQLDAFPYGYVMWFALLPLTLICKLVGIPVVFAYGATLLVADFSLLLVLCRMLPGRDRQLLATYWLSPIVLLASYCLGLNDLIPVLLLVLALYCTKRFKLFAAGVFCAAAISAKLSMLLAVPFFLIYLVRNRALRTTLFDFAKGGLLVVVLVGLPFIFSQAGLQMLLSNPEMDKAYRLALRFDSTTVVYFLPLAYMVMLYFFWRVRRINFDLFNALMGLGFLLVVLLTPASPGWFIWIVPVLVFYQAISGKIALTLCASFGAFFVLSNLQATPIAPWLHQFGLLDTSKMAMLHTILMAIGIVLAMRIWRESVSSNDYFRFSRKPIVIGIAGDSGAGKDTLAASLQGLLGTHSVAHLSGDDYHLWDRHKPMWQVMTHLNPMANDLESYANDLIALSDGKSILSRHYDHTTGKMSRPHHVQSNDFIIASGLHALYLPVLRDCYDLSIYLDIDENLRRYYKLQRDVLERGHTVEQVLSSIDNREPDSNRFIRPQTRHASLIMSLLPIHSRSLDGGLGSEKPRVKLLVRSKNGLNELSLLRVLVGICGLHVDMKQDQEANEIVMTIEGESTAEDMAMAATILLPRMLEFLTLQPIWNDGALGLMQLIALTHIDQALNKRLIW